MIVLIKIEEENNKSHLTREIYYDKQKEILRFVVFNKERELVKLPISNVFKLSITTREF